MPKVRTLDDIKTLAKSKHGVSYEYLGLGPYQGVEKTVEYVCAIHGKKTQRISQHLKTGCGDCARVRNGEAKRETLDSYKSKAERKFGSTFKYLNLYRVEGKTRIKFLCSSHGEIDQLATWHLNSSHGCPVCAKENTPRGFAADSSESWEARAKTALGNSYLGVVTKNSRRYAQFTCDIHGIQEVIMHNIERGSRCLSCSYENRGKVRLTEWSSELEISLNEIHKSKYTYQGLGIDVRGKRTVIYTCPDHGKVEQNLKDHCKGIGCAKCTHIVSAPSVEIYNYISSLGLIAKQEVRLTNSKNSWDIVVDSAKLAIEYHGLYWHSSAFHGPSYHLNKHKEGLKAGYRTIHIFSDEWQDKKEIVKKILATQLGANAEEKIYARNCTIAIIDSVVASAFLEKHHIQGCGGKGSRFIGLKVADTLVSVLAYRMQESGRGNKVSNISCEISRYASSTGVVGGFSKLVNHLKKAIPSITCIHTFSDIRMFTGNMYEKCGFTQEYVTKPDYFYTNSKVRMHKANFQKSKFRSSPRLIYEEGKTELELAHMNRLYRVYDCGKIKWIKHYK